VRLTKLWPRLSEKRPGRIRAIIFPRRSRLPGPAAFPPLPKPRSRKLPKSSAPPTSGKSKLNSSPVARVVPTTSPSSRVTKKARLVIHHNREQPTKILVILRPAHFADRRTSTTNSAHNLTFEILPPSLADGLRTTPSCLVSSKQEIATEQNFWLLFGQYYRNDIRALTDYRLLITFTPTDQTRT